MRSKCEPGRGEVFPFRPFLECRDCHQLSIVKAGERGVDHLVHVHEDVRVQGEGSIPAPFQISVRVAPGSTART
jgi:hypothetical protein